MITQHLALSGKKAIGIDSNDEDDLLDEPLYVEDYMDPKMFQMIMRKSLMHFVALIIDNENDGWKIKFSEFKQGHIKWPTKQHIDVMDDPTF